MEQRHLGTAKSEAKNGVENYSLGRNTYSLPLKMIEQCLTHTAGAATTCSSATFGCGVNPVTPRYAVEAKLHFITGESIKAVSLSHFLIYLRMRSEQDDVEMGGVWSMQKDPGGTLWGRQVRDASWPWSEE